MGIFYIFVLMFLALVAFILSQPMKAKSPALSHWIDYDQQDVKTYPPEYGKYLVVRKDGKIHWETWNMSGWAYNNNSIAKYACIVKPK